jgi:hypothetical protein
MFVAQHTLTTTSIFQPHGNFAQGPKIKIYTDSIISTASYRPSGKKQKRAFEKGFNNDMTTARTRLKKQFPATQPTTKPSKN